MRLRVHLSPDGNHLIKRFTELQRRIAGVHNHPILIIDNAFKRTRRHIKHEPDTAGHALEEPDMRHRNRKFDVSHAFSSDLGLCNFDAAAVADDAFVLYPFIFTAIAFPVFLRSENPFAEETAFFRLETSVIDRLGILDLTVTPGADHFRGCNLDGYHLKGAHSRSLLLCGHFLAVKTIVNHFGFLRILLFRRLCPLDRADVEAQALHFFQKNVERFGPAGPQVCSVLLRSTRRFVLFP